MSVLRNHLWGALFASFGVGLCLFALMPRETGYQDTASSLAQPSVAKHWQEQVPSGTSPIQLAIYSPSTSIGAQIPQVATYRATNFDNSDITGSIPRNRVLQTTPRYQASDYPKVDRTLKGDRLVASAPSETVAAPPETVAPAAEPEDSSRSNGSVFGAKSVEAPDVAPNPDMRFAASQPLR